MEPPGRDIMLSSEARPGVFGGGRDGGEGPAFAAELAVGIAKVKALEGGRRAFAEVLTGMDVGCEPEESTSR
jgi:hypothetical protein